MPVDRRYGDEILQPLQFPGDDGPVGLHHVSLNGQMRWDCRVTHPRTGIANVDMIPSLLGRKLGPLLLGDEVPERAHLPLELARLVARLHPLGDLVHGVFLFGL